MHRIGGTAIMTVLQALYEVLNHSHSFIIDFHADSFHYCIGITDKLRINKFNEIVGEHITIRDVKSFSVLEEDDEFNTTSLILTFEDCATVKISCF